MQKSSSFPVEQSLEDSSRVLIADDDVLFCQVLEDELIHYGYAVTALTQLESLEEAYLSKKPGYLVVDYQFPDTTGIEMLGELERFNQLDDVATIVMSGHRHAQEKAREYGAHFIEKPFMVEDLVEMMRALGD